METIDRLGVWRRAGINGVVTGLHMAEAMAMAPDDCDRKFMCRLFAVAESAFCVANWQREKEPSDKDTEQS